MVGKELCLAKAVCLILSAIISSHAMAEQTYSKRKEAYGMIVGTFMAGLTVAEVCSEYPALKSEAEKTSRNYLNANIALRRRVDSTMRDHAMNSGGKAAADVLEQEIKVLGEDKTYMRREVLKTASSEKACRSLLQNLRRGYWDINTRNQEALKIIFSK